MTKSVEAVSRLAAIFRPLMNFPEVPADRQFTIGQLSSHLGVSLRTLRFYEQSGLLHPHREGVRRVYTAEERERLELIVGLREFEVSLTAIKTLMTIAETGGPNIEDRILGQFDRLLEEVHVANQTRIAELEGINGRIHRARAARA